MPSDQRASASALMQAVAYYRFGEPDVMACYGVDCPVPGASELLIEVGACSVNPIDWKVRRGDFHRAGDAAFPRIPGCDVAGTVLEVGRRVSDFRPGDRVFAVLDPMRGGAYAQYCAVPETAAARLPPELPLAHGAAVPTGALTAYQALVRHGQVSAGKRVLINGAAGGVGTFAVQIARLQGAEVVGVSSASAAELVARLGADRVLDYEREDFTAGGLTGFDIVFDAVGLSDFKRCSRLLNSHGLYISTQPRPSGLLANVSASLRPGPREIGMTTRANGADLAVLAHWLDVDLIRPVVDRLYPLCEAADAHRYSEGGHVHGKIVLEVGA